MVTKLFRYYGGWVAPKIFYLGAAGVIKIGGLRIGGVSGIYKKYNYHKGHFETPPLSPNEVSFPENLKSFTGSRTILRQHYIAAKLRVQIRV